MGDGDVTEKRVEEGALEERPDLTDEDVGRLGLVSVGCRCDSFSRYLCPLCSAVRKGVADFDRLVDMGLARFGRHAPFELTRNGLELLECRL